MRRGGPTGNVSTPGAKHGRKLPSTSDASVESLSHHRGLPIFPHRVAASFSTANPRCAGHHANLRTKLRRRTCLPGKWNPSSRRKCRAAAADRRHFRCVPAENSRIRVADKNVRGSRSNVTVSKGCQQDNGKHFRSDISVLFGVLPRSL